MFNVHAVHLGHSELAIQSFVSFVFRFALVPSAKMHLGRTDSGAGGGGAGRERIGSGGPALAAAAAAALALTSERGPGRDDQDDPKEGPAHCRKGMGWGCRGPQAKSLRPDIPTTGWACWARLNPAQAGEATAGPGLDSTEPQRMPWPTDRARGGAVKLCAARGLQVNARHTCQRR